MRKIVASALILATASCASIAAAPTEVLVAPSYRLEVTSHCAEGEVGCSKLTAVLVSKVAGTSSQLSGSTRMVMCPDGVTPCHVGYYELSGTGIKVNAYPEGTLAVALGSEPLALERGSLEPQ